MYNIRDKEKLDYFKKIVKGHTIKEIQKLYYDKYNEELSRDKVEGLKVRYNLKSGLKERPIGSEYNYRNSTSGFKMMKIGKNKWVLKHKYIYEQHYGKIPEGKCIIFLDGNRDNCSIDNLALIDKKEELMMARYGMFYKNKELTKTGVLVAKLKLKEKEKKHGKYMEKIK